MKSIVRKFITTSILAALALPSVQLASAQTPNITLEGSGFYDLERRVKFAGGRGKRQSGRYRYLGRDFYREATIGMDLVSNNTSVQSGSLSFEFWAMDFFGADTGIVLMTRGLDSLDGFDAYEELERDGNAIFLDERRFPEISVWEFTFDGWEFNDALSFSRRARL